MDYNATTGDDVLDQSKLALPDWSNIFGLAGNDTITIGVGIAIGGAGNNTITGTSVSSAAAYWGAPAGIRVNLVTGFVSNGYGGTDTLTNIHTVHGTGNSDQFIGSSGNETFFGNGGNDTFVGGGGSDQVSYLSSRSQANVTYNDATDTFTIVKNFSNGDKGTDTLTGINKIVFSNGDADNVTLYKDNYHAMGGFLHSFVQLTVPVPQADFVDQIKGGDFNGDGKMDFAITSAYGAGSAAAPIFIFLGDGNGNFTNGTSQVFQSGSLMLSGSSRALVADFNNDGISDFLQFNFGVDAPPFPGGINTLLLSSPSTQRLVDVSGTLGQTSAQNHAGSVGDVNGDGYLDLLVDTLDKGNELFLNDGTGHFTFRQDLLPSPRIQIGSINVPQTNTYSGIIDVNGDGHPDIILGKWDGSSSTSTSEILLNDGHGDFTKTAPITLPSSGLNKEIILDVKPIDLNGDNSVDLMLSVTTGTGNYYLTPYIQLLVNDGTGHFHDETAQRLPQNKLGSTGWIMSLQSVDFNHDGLADIFATSAGSPVTSKVYLNRGDGTFYVDWESDPGTKSIAEDVNNDGMTDIVSITDSGTVAVSLNGFSSSHNLSYGDVVQALYVAYFGRPADSGGWTNFEAALSTAAAPSDLQGLNSSYNSNATVKYLVDAFGTSAESNALYTGSTADFVNAIYAHVLNRASDSAGLQFWVNAIDQGILTKGNAALSIMAGALANTSAQGLIDAAVVNNKISVASKFTIAIDTPAEVQAYSGNAAAATVRSMLATVSSTTDTNAFMSTINSTLSSLTAATNSVSSIDLAMPVETHLNGVPLSLVGVPNELHYF